MKKNVRKLSAFFLVVIMVLSVSIPAMAKGEIGKVTVTFSGIYSIDDPINYYLSDEVTVKEVLADIVKSMPEISITGIESNYITEINGEKAGTFGGYDGWMFRINGYESTDGIESAVVKPGDDLVFYYADPFGVGSQFPMMNAEKLLTNKTISFYSYDTDWTDWQNPVINKNPVKGAFITIHHLTDDYVETTVYCTTNDNGEIVLPSKVFKEGQLTLTIGKYSYNGIPMVALRSFTVDLKSPFSDVPLTAWYANAVIWGLNNNVAKGIGGNMFGTGRQISRAEFVTMLANYEGIDPADYSEKTNPFNDVVSGSWYAPFVEWAYRNGIINGKGPETFDPAGPITRESAAVIIANNYKSEEMPLPSEEETAEILNDAYLDADSISAWARTAVAFVTDCGYMSGSAQHFNPSDTITREQSVQIFFNISNAANIYIITNQ